MQLDFFRRLSGALKGRKTPAPRPAAPVHNPAGDLEQHARQLLHQIGCEALAAKVQVRWNPRMRSTAGLAYPGKSLIVLNPRLIPFGAEEVNRTLRHELAHLLAHHRVGRRRISPHGPEWKKACRDLGLDDEKRCHELPLPRREVARKYAYECPGCRVKVHRVRPIRRKSACLACCRAHNRGKYDERFRFVRVTG